MRRFLAWESVLEEKDRLSLSLYQVKQAETQKSTAESAVTARLPETYQWLLVPTQKDASAPIHWEATRLSGGDALAIRASKKLKNDELLITSFAASRLRMELDRVPLWCGDHVSVKQLVDDFARYLYLPRLADPNVLLEAIGNGVALLAWEQDGFAYAEAYDELAKRYRGLRAGQQGTIPDRDAPGLLVKPGIARAQLEAETAPGEGSGTTAVVLGGGDSTGTSTPQPGKTGAPPAPPESQKPKRFHGTVALDPARAGRDASRIADEVIAHLAGLVDANVRVTLEVEAEIPEGVPDNVVRTVTENSRTLKFTSQGFEEE